VDVAAIGAHPDDVEISVGGTLAKLRSRGYSLALIDMTRGEMGTRGTPERRADEAAAAAQALGAVERVNLDLGDGVMENTLANRVKLVQVLRRLRPKIVLAPYWEDLHPDHSVAGRIACDIMYPLGFEKFPAEGEPYRPGEFLFYLEHFVREPSFIVDVSGFLEQKLRAVRCYASQLHDPHSTERDTGISRPDFLDRIEARARHFGSMIRAAHGEPFLTRRAVPLDDPVAAYRAWAH
jgi:bacillithiol biosynthesis deacetylase BshB1